MNLDNMPYFICMNSSVHTSYEKLFFQCIFLIKQLAFSIVKQLVLDKVQVNTLI